MPCGLTKKNFLYLYNWNICKLSVDSLLKVFKVHFLWIFHKWNTDCEHVPSTGGRWWEADCRSSFFTISQSLLKLMSIDSVIPSNHLLLCHPLLLLPSIFPSIRVFSNESALLIRWPKYWSFSFNISPSNEHTELISFWMNWLDLLAVQGSLRSLLWHDSSKASLPGLSFPYSPTLTSTHDYWKNYSLDYMDLCGQGNISAF